MRKSVHFFIGIIICLLFMGTAFAFQPFPDTGQTMCYDAGNNAVPCDTIQPGDTFYGQDPHYTPRIPRSYTKLGHGGTVLADNAIHVDDGGPWIMTMDNVTGLIWELKRSESPHLQNTGNSYTWYDPNPETNGGNEGTQNGGTCTGSDCDTYSYIQALNTQQLGGFSDWRLPTRAELSSLVNRFVHIAIAAIDTDFFPNTVSHTYWSSTTYAGNTNSAWRVNFNSGQVYGGNKSYYSLYVRAVRSGPPPQPSLVDNGDGTVTDTTTGLMWQKCSYGQTWEAGQCTGSAATMNWQQALEYTEGLNLGDYSDWRLPNINELQTLVDDTTYSPAIDTVFFPNTVSHTYWSSTNDSHFTFYAWHVYFYYGSVNYYGKSSSRYVRAVRSGKSDIGSFGSLQIEIEPQEAWNAGAQWRIKGTSTWYYSGETVRNIPIGKYTIEFKVVPGWRPEETITVNVEAITTATGTGSYFEQATVLPGVMMLLLGDYE